MSCKFKKSQICNKNCKYWINYSEDNNCCLESIEKHGELSLREVAKRLNITYVGVLQVERRALKKMKKNKFIYFWNFITSEKIRIGNWTLIFTPMFPISVIALIIYIYFLG